MNIFAKLNQGDTAQWDDAPVRDSQGRNYDAASWALRYEIRGPASLTLNAVASGIGWHTTLNAANSATLVAGTYYWAAYLTNGVERVTAGTGTFVVAPDLAQAAAGYDGRTPSEKALAAIEAQLLARANGDLVTEYAIGDRSLKKEPTSELLALRSHYVILVRRDREAEQVANGLGNPRRVMVRFG